MLITAACFAQGARGELPVAGHGCHGCGLTGCGFMPQGSPTFQLQDGCEYVFVWRTVEACPVVRVEGETGPLLGRSGQQCRQLLGSRACCASSRVSQNTYWG